MKIILNENVKINCNFEKIILMITPCSMLEATQVVKSESAMKNVCGCKCSLQLKEWLAMTHSAMAISNG